MKGYIRKRGKVYSYTVDIGRDPLTGKRKQKSKSGFKTKKEAQAALAELVTRTTKGEAVDFRKIMFKDFATDYFENNYKQRVKVSTYDRTSSILFKQIIPYFENVELRKMDQYMVHDFYRAKANEGYAPHYVSNMHNMLKLLLGVAKKWQLIEKDIVSMIEAPHNPKKEMKYWSIEQVNTFLERAKSSRYYPVFFLAAYTGMRKGEILGLTWNDIDFKKMTIDINKTLFQLSETKGYNVGSPKTKNAVRTIYFDEEVERVLQSHRIRQNEEKLKNRPIYQDEGLVFSQEDGGFVNPTAVNHMMKWFIDHTDLPFIRFHDLRHTHATILLQMGVNPKVVSDRLGHSSVQITLDVYSHVTKEIRKDLSKEFSNMMKSGQNVSNSK